MITGETSPMACGNCGHGLFRMYQQQQPKQKPRLIAECNECKSTSTISVSVPELVIGWGEQSDGILCRMEPKP